MNILLTTLLAFNVNTAPITETFTNPITYIAETEEIVPISTPVVELTEEQLDALIAAKLEELLEGGMTLVVEWWQGLLTVLGAGSVAAISYLASFILKRLGMFNGNLLKTDGIVAQNTDTVKILDKDIIELKKVLLGFIAIANVDNAVKADMIAKLTDNVSLKEFGAYAATVDATKEDAALKETTSLLSQITGK